MGLRYWCVLILGAVVIIGMLLIKKKGDIYIGGKKVLGMNFLEDDPYYRKKLKHYKRMVIWKKISLLIAIAMSLVLIARPYVSREEQEEKENDDTEDTAKAKLEELQKESAKARAEQNEQTEEGEQVWGYEGKKW